jgi:cephalosporin-C deacetylase
VSIPRRLKSAVPSTRYVFMADSFKPGTVRPDDFEAYWQRVTEELDALPLAPEVEELPLRETEFSKTYAVHYTGIGPYRLFGYLSLPKGQGPFPTMVYMSRYQSVHELIPQGDASEKRQRYAIFTAAARGQRNADRPYAAAFPGIFTDGIEDPQRYIFRGFVADCCRAVDYILTRPEVDPGRIACLADNDLSLLTAALRDHFSQIIATPTFFYAATDLAPQTEAYPREEINDYLRLYPERRDLIARTLAYFEPLFFAPKIKAKTLLWGDPETIGPLAEAIAGEVEQQSSVSRYKDGVYQEQWLAHQWGFEDAILPAHWQ